MNDSYDAEYQDHATMWRNFVRLMSGCTVFAILVLVGLAVTLV
ncbi:MAG: hypothetical protein VCD50_08485 [Alphaproteobacteria bacterium]|jgi:hypothetical protein